MSERRKLVKRVQRKAMGGTVYARVYDDGSVRIRTDHPSNDPAVEIAMAAAAIMAGDRYCPDPSVHEGVAAARAEGHREAVRVIRDAARADACTTLTEDWCADEDHIDRLHAALRVAGLNASEPPPTDPKRMGGLIERAIRESRRKNGLLPDGWTLVEMALAYPPDTPDEPSQPIRVGDASESGQPPEASDE